MLRLLEDCFALYGSLDGVEAVRLGNEAGMFGYCKRIDRGLVKWVALYTRGEEKYVQYAAIGRENGKIG